MSNPKAAPAAVVAGGFTLLEKGLAALLHFQGMNAFYMVGERDAYLIPHELLTGFIRGE